MESLGTAKAAARLEVSVQQFHRLTRRHQLNPVFQATGRTGEKFWNPADVDRLAVLLTKSETAA